MVRRRDEGALLVPLFLHSLFSSSSFDSANIVLLRSYLNRERERDCVCANSGSDSLATASPASRVILFHGMKSNAVAPAEATPVSKSPSSGVQRPSRLKQVASKVSLSAQKDVSFGDVAKTVIETTMKTRLGEIQAGNFAFSARGNVSKEQKRATLTSLPSRRASLIGVSEPTWIKEELKETNADVAWYNVVIHPNSQFRRSWDVMVVLFVTFYLIAVPLEFGFFWWENVSTMNTVSYVIDTFFWVDIFLNFRTGYIAYGEVVLDRKKIAEKYMRTWLLIDLVSVLPLELLAATEQTDFKTTRKSVKLASKWLKIPKLLRLARVMKSWKRHIRFKPIVEVVAVSVLALHIGACLGILTSLRTDDVLMMAISDWEIYGIGLHNALLMCMGSPIDAYSWPAQYPIRISPYLQVFFGIIGVCILVTTIACVTIVVSQKTVAYARFRQKWDQVLQEMHYYHVPEHIQERVKQYYEYLWVHQKHHSFNSLYHESSNLSLNLRKEVALFLHRDLVLAVPLFSDVSIDCAAAVAMSLSVQIYMPEDWIIREGEVGREMYIISKGTVVLLESGVAFVELGAGSFFGEIALLENIRRTCDVKAVDLCEIGVLSKEFFDVLTEDYPDLRERTSQIAVGRIGVGDDDDALEKYDNNRTLLLKSGKSNRVSRVKSDALKRTASKNELEAANRIKEKVKKELKNNLTPLMREQSSSLLVQNLFSPKGKDKTASPGSRLVPKSIRASIDENSADMSSASDGDESPLMATYSASLRKDSIAHSARGMSAASAIGDNVDSQLAHLSSKLDLLQDLILSEKRHRTSSSRSMADASYRPGLLVRKTSSRSTGAVDSHNLTLNRSSGYTGGTGGGDLTGLGIS